MHKNLRDIAIEALVAAHRAHDDLGHKGEDLIKKNQFGDSALRVDIECERAVLQVLRQNRVAIKVVSEEHGVTSLSEEMKYLGVLDGIDGTALYKKARGKARYGTMFAVFQGLTPRYRDYLVCGIMQHSTNRIFLAEKGKGAYALNVSKRQKAPELVQPQRIQTSDKRFLKRGTKIYIDEYFSYNRETFSRYLHEFSPGYEMASSLYYAALAEGSADLVLECTRKANLEIAVEYGLTVEAGGVVVDLTGQDLGPQRYFEFGQESHRGVISAANEDLANELLKKLNYNPNS